MLPSLRSDGLIAAPLTTVITSVEVDFNPITVITTLLKVPYANDSHFDRVTNVQSLGTGIERGILLFRSF